MAEIEKCRTAEEKASDILYGMSNEEYGGYNCILSEWMDEVRNVEVLILYCEYDDCKIMNRELEEIGLSECTF